MDKPAIAGGRPVRDTFLPYGRQWLDEEDRQAVLDALHSDFITQGPKIGEFEQAVAAYVGARHAVAFSNGTAALHGACFAANIGEGDEVITTPITFAASSNCVLYAGATPVFADIDPKTYNLDPSAVRDKITPRTRAVIAVDYTGQPVDVDAFRRLCEEHRLVLIQDAAHSLGASWNGAKIGSLADMTMFSFHPVKHITTGEGGLIVTDNDEYANRLRLFRSHGITKNPDELEQQQGPWYHEMHELGYNYRMTDLQAALGVTQMRKLDAFVARRREIVERYNRAFADLQGVTVPHQLEGAESSWHLYVLRFDRTRFQGGRKAIFEALQAENIGVNVHYLPVYLHPYYRRLGYPQGLCPQAEDLYEEIVTLPLFPKMTDQDADDVIRAVRKVTQHLGQDLG